MHTLSKEYTVAITMVPVSFTQIPVFTHLSYDDDDSKSCDIRSFSTVHRCSEICIQLPAVRLHFAVLHCVVVVIMVLVKTMVIIMGVGCGGGGDGGGDDGLG